jgi:hypothetical protein
MDVSNAAAALAKQSRYAAAQAQLKPYKVPILEKKVTMRYKAT